MTDESVTDGGLSDFPGSAWHQFRFKVLLAFQVGEDGAVSQRRRVVCFGARDSLNTVYREVSGKARGVKPLWPRDFHESVVDGFITYLYVSHVGGAASEQGGQWHLPMPEIRLFELAESWLETPDNDFIIQVLFRLEDPKETSRLDPRLMLAVGWRRRLKNIPYGCIGSTVFFQKNTFLHFGEMTEENGVDGEEDSYVVPEERPLSEPGWSCEPHIVRADKDKDQTSPQQSPKRSRSILASNTNVAESSASATGGTGAFDTDEVRAEDGGREGTTRESDVTIEEPSVMACPTGVVETSADNAVDNELVDTQVCNDTAISVTTAAAAVGVPELESGATIETAVVEEMATPLDEEASAMCVDVAQGTAHADVECVVPTEIEPVAEDEAQIEAEAETDAEAKAEPVADDGIEAEALADVAGSSYLHSQQSEEVEVQASNDSMLQRTEAGDVETISLQIDDEPAKDAGDLSDDGVVSCHSDAAAAGIADSVSLAGVDQPDPVPFESVVCTAVDMETKADVVVSIDEEAQSSAVEDEAHQGLAERIGAIEFSLEAKQEAEHVHHVISEGGAPISAGTGVAQTEGENDDDKEGKSELAGICVPANANGADASEVVLDAEAADVKVEEDAGQDGGEKMVEADGNESFHSDNGKEELVQQATEKLKEMEKDEGNDEEIGETQSEADIIDGEAEEKQMESPEHEKREDQDNSRDFEARTANGGEREHAREKQIESEKKADMHDERETDEKTEGNKKSTEEGMEKQIEEEEKRDAVEAERGLEDENEEETKKGKERGKEKEKEDNENDRQMGKTD
eukprot:TRINITY_DN1893_c0_g1_i2.p1 TRINITY_DN1893_c0_g1~~TRINITY_DN1893_c0_g1_i2.p1  ORF type:complete len:805 (-),score=208.00 TRINITY_DN1893_c0_g1_i2:394-2808(-)